MLPPPVRPRDRISEINLFSTEDTLYDRVDMVSHPDEDFFIAVPHFEVDSISQFGDIWLEPILILSQLVGDYFYRPRVPTNVFHEKTGAGIVFEDLRVVILPSGRS